MSATACELSLRLLSIECARGTNIAGAESTELCNPGCDGQQFNHPQPASMAASAVILSAGSAPAKQAKRRGGNDVDGVEPKRLKDGASTRPEDLADSPGRNQIRKECADAQQKQANGMRSRTLNKFGPEPKVGSLVQVKIPDVDRCKGDPTALTMVVIEVKVRPPPHSPLGRIALLCVVVGWDIYHGLAAELCSDVVCCDVPVRYLS